MTGRRIRTTMRLDQKPDWHCIEDDDAHNIEVSGLTCVIRSRTWSVQIEGLVGLCV